MDDSFVLEDVDLLNPGDGVDTQPLERVLQAFVVRRCCLVYSLFLPAGDMHGVTKSHKSHKRHNNTYRRIVPFPPVRTAPAIFMSLSRFICVWV